MNGWDGYHLDLQGTEVDDPREGAPWWHFDLQDGPLIIELRAVGAAKTPTPVMALIRWEPGAEVSPSIQVTSSEWVDDELLAAGYALKRLLGTVFRKRPGRHKRWTLAREPLFFEELDRVAHTAVREGEDLTAASLSRHGLGDPRPISEALRLYGYDLDKVEAEAIRCNKGRGREICTFHVRDRAKFKKKRG